jgi:hypothetical protein
MLALFGSSAFGLGGPAAEPIKGPHLLFSPDPFLLRASRRIFFVLKVAAGEGAETLLSQLLSAQTLFHRGGKEGL